MEEALAGLDAYLRSQPDSAPFLNLRGLVRHELRDLAGALADFDAAVAAVPDFAGAHHNRGMALLLQGDYARGWPEYAWRTRVPGHSGTSHLSYGMPRWTGQNVAGRRLLVHGEQGQGDTIQFARFLGPLALDGAIVDVFCHAPLAALVGRMPGVRRASARLEEGREHDYHASLLDVGIARLPEASAPHWFGAYVRPLPARVERFRRLLDDAPRPRVGIAWKGSALNPNDRNRSLTREAAATLLRTGATFVNLQLGEPPLDDRMFDAAAIISDWDDTAAVVSLLDHVVCVDTAVAHLAGAMGRPVTLLLAFAADWRWGTGGDATPWYPSMRLRRQSRRGDWSEPVAAALRDIA